jgi:hypothetical protein
MAKPNGQGKEQAHTWVKDSNRQNRHTCADSGNEAYGL